MSEIPFMQWYPGDYVQKTANLTTEQHGAYLLMLFAAWGKGGCRLPNNDQQLASIIRLNVRKWKAMKPIIMEFWTEEDGFIYNKRQRNDYQKATEKRGRRAAAGALGGAANALKSLPGTPNNATSLLDVCSSKSEPEPEPERKKPPVVPQGGKPKAKTKRKTSLPKQFPDSEALDAALTYWDSINRNDLLPDEEALKFQDHCLANGTTYIDWRAGWRTWYKRAPQFNRASPATNGKDTKPDWAREQDTRNAAARRGLERLREEHENGHTD